jgi:hypothetical protein
MKVFGLAFKVAIVMFVALVIFLAIFNPEKKEFIDAAEKKWSETSMNTSEDATLLSDEAKDFMREMADAMVTRNNYFIGSVFEFKMGGKQYQYLGLAHWFIPLQKEVPPLAVPS